MLILTSRASSRRFSFSSRMPGRVHVLAFGALPNSGDGVELPLVGSSPWGFRRAWIAASRLARSSSPLIVALMGDVKAVRCVMGGNYYVSLRGHTGILYSAPTLRGICGCRQPRSGLLVLELPLQYPVREVHAVPSIVSIYKKSIPIPTLKPRASRSPLRAMMGMEKLSSIRSGSKRYISPRPTLRLGFDATLATLSANERARVRYWD